ncbi:MAG: 4-hydroxy-3-methylbut-2-enyl diphosphate reductase [Bacteroidales bacterium]|jgi:4-hydroxy-3-methylbut-2-en-1-yl diphosphate reductase|nr:4-hydroxy-3-methylbut-2-enyl diphosphate reductase [Bacteroidales bacterium]MDD2205339.1 4-hydroxy-3-methylbut-2-enyl diphosphate reductase [Bacteroidales bacterium]MDD3152769.1 4-hydroxy-3-methylbut-2-enyl diphosphate reductase [Bacteroidales bacterium]MDD3914128.1 4-hydroxy-3-methylbut-2-enyl diphosphate reductase [Bacteroidales bacterium]MDD4634080.1 4-hydroxy-3-methylbut-2-enyl diphosphate reductase [Bacteroidales bacterium]
MKITIDKNAGFCFGVTKAIELANDYLKNNNSLYCLGELVHNEEEMNKLKQSGLKIISYNDLDVINSSAILFRAHGEPNAAYTKAKLLNNTIIDSTCPIVKQLQKKVVAAYNAGEKIFIYGKKTHPEVIGIIGNINDDAVVFDDVNELNYLHESDKITLYSQTTMQPDKYQDVIKQLKDRGVIVNAIDSICSSFNRRLIELKDFCTRYDVIIIVAGKSSSNGKSLYSISKSINHHSYIVSSEEELQPEWFKGCNTVGISGATSTPLSLLKRVERAIKKLV